MLSVLWSTVSDYSSNASIEMGYTITLDYQLIMGWCLGP
jgi:hypothetical protein